MDAKPTLLGGVDEEDPAKRPEGLAAERAFWLLVQYDDASASIGQLGRRDETSQSCTDDDDVSVRQCASVR